MGSNLSRTVIVARPLSEPQPAESAAETASTSAKPLPKAVGAGETLCEQVDEKGSRKADHVQVVTFDPLHERGTEALDRVAACALTPFLARDVEAELPRRQCAERHAGDRVPHLIPRRRQQA